MFTPGYIPTHGSPYDDVDTKGASEEQEEISWPAVVAIVVLAVGIAVIVTPYNLFQLWRHGHDRVHPPVSPGGHHG